jgi:hypothetical protein
MSQDLRCFHQSNTGIMTRVKLMDGIDNKSQFHASGSSIARNSKVIQFRLSPDDPTDY